MKGVGTFTFDPVEVNTKRPDLFNPGHFSLFDVLVHLHEQGLFELEYYFDESMNTYVIDSLDGQTGWWYNAYYDGGWPELSVFRMDHYPVKDSMVIRYRLQAERFFDGVYATYREEVERKALNEGAVVIPVVEICGKSFAERFYDVEVKPHDLRSDVFQEGTVTAIDVILSLGEAGKISYDLQWYDSIGSAEVVRSFWVNRINADESQGRCGFVYEAGAREFAFFRGNHNHIPSDTRVINSPEYVEYFWICI